ncbi:MAG: spermidine synthase, partial [Candidatus Hydrothermarchaeales archaeon]
AVKQVERRFLLVTAFISGMTIMALEMSASRLLAPYFGTSLFVWTNIIGVTMISLSIGYYYGGKLADRNPVSRLLFGMLVATGLFCILIPFLAPFIMRLSVKGIKSGSAGIFYGSLLGTVLLFAPPLTALGGVVPFIIRLFGGDRKSSGITAGRVFAVSTVGSIMGTFLPVLLTIPLLGTKRTILLFGVILILFGLFGLGRKRQAGLAVLLLLSAFFVGSARPAEGVIYEKESVYNYIQVVEKEGIRYLKLNEGYAYHSIYNPHSVTVNGIWDYFNLLPLLKQDAKSTLIIGLAGGTIAREYRFFFPHIKIDGVEIDGDIIEAGKAYFDMEGPNLAIHHMDGRTFLSTTEKRYDIIIIDAYKQPYIPFHLTTQEFFVEVKKHLKDGGIVAINIASLSPDSKVLKMLENTMAEIYKKVYVLNPPGTLNYIVFASERELSFDVSPDEPVLKEIVAEAERGFVSVELDRNLPILTDDKAPVEMYTDMMIFEYIRSNDTRAYTQFFE